MSFHAKASLLLVFLLASALGAIAAPARSFYVDSVSGNDAASGLSPGFAWKSIAKANTQVFAPGDRLLFHAGQQFAGMLQPRGSGSAPAPILLTRYGAGRPPHLSGDGGPATVTLVDVSYWIVRDLDISNNAEREAKRSGIILASTLSGGIVRGLTIDHVSIHDVRGFTGEENTAKDTGGIGIFSPVLDQPAHFDGVLIQDCTITHVDNIGIWINTSPVTNPVSSTWTQTANTHIRIADNHISDTGRNAIIVRQSLAPIIEGNTITHSSARHHGNAVFTRSTRDAIIRANQVSFTGTEPSGENAAFDADIDSIHTVIEYNWSHDNQGGLFSLCNNPSDDTNETDGTVVRFNISENDGVRAFGFSGRATNTLVYNNTVLIGAGHKAAIVEARPFSKTKPRYADDARFFNNLVIALGDVSYDFGEATKMQFDSNCTIGKIRPLPSDPPSHFVSTATALEVKPATSWRGLAVYRASAKACGRSRHSSPDGYSRDILGVLGDGPPFYGALQPSVSFILSP